jgi:hypothetical protein
MRVRSLNLSRVVILIPELLKMHFQVRELVQVHLGL